MLARNMGWDVLYDAIASWILGIRNLTPAFAQGVAAWQGRNRQPVTGILDAATWRSMLADAKAGIPRPFRTPEGIARNG